jgi:hypothetical protein
MAKAESLLEKAFFPHAFTGFESGIKVVLDFESLICLDK